MTFWGMGNALHKGGMVSPGLWLRRESLAVLAGNRPDVIHTDLAACNAYKDAPARAAAVKCPTVLVLGDGDLMTPAAKAKPLAAAIAGSKTVVIPNSGHIDDGGAARRNPGGVEVLCLIALPSLPARPPASVPPLPAACRATATSWRFIRAARPMSASAMAKELGKASYHQADLGDETAARGLVASVLEAHGRLDVLVNNAGLSIRIPHTDLKAATPALWRQMLDVNLIAPFVLVAEAEAALRRSARAAGRPASSTSARMPARGPRARRSPMRPRRRRCITSRNCWRCRWDRTIRVNAVAPGLVETPMTANWPDMLEMWKAKSPMKRPAKPEDIADLVAALCANDYVTGEIVIADGGLNLT